MTLFPSISTLGTSFDLNGSHKDVQSSRYWISSALDDAKNKAIQLSKEAEVELRKADESLNNYAKSAGAEVKKFGDSFKARAEDELRKADQSVNNYTKETADKIRGYSESFKSKAEVELRKADKSFNDYANEAGSEVKRFGETVIAKTETELGKAGLPFGIKPESSIPLNSTKYFLTCGFGGTLGKFPISCLVKC